MACETVSDVSFRTGPQSVFGGHKTVASQEETGETHAEVSHLKLSETQGRFLVLEGSLFANKNMRQVWHWKWASVLVRPGTRMGGF